MTMLRWMSDKTGKDMIRNEDISDNLGVASIGDKDERTAKDGLVTFLEP